MRLPRIPFLVMVGLVLIVSLMAFWPITSNSQPPPAAAPRWDNRFLTALTPDSILARHSTFDTLPNGILRTEWTVPFLSPQDYLAMGSDFMGCPCCPEPRRTTYSDSMPLPPPCCVPCLTMFHQQAMSRRDPMEILTEQTPYLTTRQVLPRGIVSIYGAVEIRRNGDATDSLPLRLDVNIKGVTATPLNGDAGALTTLVPPGMHANGHLRAAGVRRDFRVSGGMAEITLISSMTGAHSGEQIADGVLGIIYLPDMRPPGTE